MAASAHPKLDFPRRQRLGADVLSMAPGLVLYQKGETLLDTAPKVSAKSDLGRLGTSDLVGRVNADAAYCLPIEGEPSAWSGFRLGMNRNKRAYLASLVMPISVAMSKKLLGFPPAAALLAARR
jgi:hypothetical protein